MIATDAHAQSFAAHLRALKRQVADMTEEERLLTVFSCCDDLIDFYLQITAVHRAFHDAFQNGTLPIMPIVGNA
jgi:hypothetical protein